MEYIKKRILLKAETENRDIYVTPLEIRELIKDKETCSLLMESGGHTRSKKYCRCNELFEKGRLC